MHWRAYWLILLAGFRRQSRYRLALLAGLLANTVFGLIRASVLGATLLAAGGHLAGYSYAELMTFVWLGQGLLGSLNMWGRTDLTERVRAGDIAVDYARPVSVVGAYLATDLGAALYTLLPRGVPALCIGWLAFDLAFAPNAINWFIAPFSIIAGIVISQLVVYSIALLGFWVVETRGFMMAYAVGGSFLAGLAIPVRLMPGWLAAIADATPFPSMLQAPLDIAAGRVLGMEAVAVFGGQLAWLTVMGLLVAGISRLGRRHLEVQGG